MELKNLGKLPIAIIGAGPVGLAAAAHLIKRNLQPMIFEKGSAPADAVRSWSHVRVFSPWLYNIDEAARSLLEETGWRAPNPEDLPTGAELLNEYLEPLARHPKVAPNIRYDAKVTAITRKTSDGPFLVQWTTGEQQKTTEAAAVIDASGTWFNPNGMATDGRTIPGEYEFSKFIEYGIPELQSSNEEYESAKEQLESTNEELATLNEELQTRNLELDQSNTDLKELRDFAEAVVKTILQPLVTLDQNLKVKEANFAFYEKFFLTPEKVEGIYFFDIDEKAWDSADLRKGLKDVFESEKELKRFSVEHDFPRLGRRILLLNARRIVQKNGREQYILLAIEDSTDRKRLEEASATLIKDIHHRVKNNLQVITSLLGLQSRFVHDADSAVEAFKESANRVRSMALIHEKLYESQETGKMHFTKYVEDLAKSLFSFYNVDSKTIQLQVDVVDVYLNMDQAVPCGLIINELISNSLKHAFPENKKGRIAVKMSRLTEKREKKTRSVAFSISDDGIGLPPTIDVQKPDSLGLKIVRSLVGQLNGSYKVSRDHGAHLQITFPEAPEDAPAIEETRPHS